MHVQLIVVFISVIFALVGIQILISGFDDDDDDGDGMGYSIKDNYHFLITDGS